MVRNADPVVPRVAALAGEWLKSGTKVSCLSFHPGGRGAMKQQVATREPGMSPTFDLERNESRCATGLPFLHAALPGGQVPKVVSV